MRTATYEVRGFDPPDRPPLAYADDLETATKATVELLHSEFFDQLDTNGEGPTGASQNLAVLAAPTAERTTSLGSPAVGPEPSAG